MYSLLERGGTSCCRRANAPAREQSSAHLVLVQRYFALPQALFEEITYRTSCTESPYWRVLSSSSPRLGSLAASCQLRRALGARSLAPSPRCSLSDEHYRPSRFCPSRQNHHAPRSSRDERASGPGRPCSASSPSSRSSASSVCSPLPPTRACGPSASCVLSSSTLRRGCRADLAPPRPLLSRPQSYLVVQRGETTKGLAYALGYSWLLYGCGGSFWMAYWRGGGVVPGAGDYKRSDEEARVADEGVKADVETFLLGRGSTEEEAVPRGEGGVETERLLDDEEAGHARPARGHARRMLQVKSDGTARFCRKVRPSPPSRWRNEADPGFPARSATSPSPTARTTARPVDAASSRWTITVPGSVEAASCVLSPALVGSSRRPSLADFAHAPPRLAGLGKLQVRASLDLLLSSRATLRSAIGPEPS